jgi:FkbM family methyltransferase
MPHHRKESRRLAALEPLLWYARHGAGRRLRRSAFRKFCRRHRGEIRIAETRDGVRLETVLGDSVDNTIFVYGEFEPVTSTLFRMLAPKVSTLIDVGCNIGYFATLLARCNPQATVIAIDANPRMVERARRNVALNAGMAVEFLAEGLAAEPGRLVLNVPKTRHSLASFAYAAGSEKAADIESIEVPVTTLHHVLSKTEVGLGIFVKVDTEGFEHAVLSGLEPGDIDRVDALLIEANHNNLARAGITLEKLLSFAWMDQFRWFEVDDAAGRLVVTDRATVAKRSAINTNLLFLRDGYSIFCRADS